MDALSKCMFIILETIVNIEYEEYTFLKVIEVTKNVVFSKELVHVY